MKLRFISIVIPLFNKKEYILRAVNSVLNQTHSTFELIIVDDGSTDGSSDIVQSIADPRVQLITQANGGVSRARNVGVGRATGEWISFLDADDEYGSEFLKRVVEFINDHDGDDLSIIGANYYLGNGDVASDQPTEDGVYDYFQLFRNQRSPNNSSTTAVNKEKFIEVGGFPEGVKQFEDWTTWFKLATVGEFGFISDPLGTYYQVEGSVAQSKRSLADFYHDAVYMAGAVSKSILKRSFYSARAHEAWGCLNELVINIAEMLARDGAKRKACKMLGFVNAKHLTIRRRGHLGGLILHLVVPQWVKQVYWRLG